VEARKKVQQQKEVAELENLLCGTSKEQRVLVLAYMESSPGTSVLFQVPLQLLVAQAPPVVTASHLR